jgi:hypothetical protein
LKPLFGVLLGIYRGTPLHANWVLACLEGAWTKLVGDRLAAVCRPAGLRDSELIVEILDSDWVEAVKGVESLLQKKLETVTSGMVKKLSFSCRRIISQPNRDEMQKG